MEERWLAPALIVLALVFILLSTQPVAALCSYCIGGVCNSNCESGESSYCDDCSKAFCGAGDPVCDVGLGENCNSCPSNCGYCDGHSCTTGGQCQGRYCVCGVCSSTAPGTNACCSDTDCSADYYGNWGSPYCKSDGNVWHSRTFYDNYCNVNKQCAQSMSSVEQLAQTCTSGCSGGQCLSCTQNATYHCDATTQKIYWYNSCGQQGDVKQDCAASTTTGQWGTNYCKDTNVYHNKTAQYYGCNATDTTCHSTTTQLIEEQVQACTNGCTTGACNPGCSNEQPCTAAGQTGCSLDYVKNYTCRLATDGCLHPSWGDCTGGRCYGGVCVTGCTADAACDDQKPCTTDTCTITTEQCIHANLPTSQACVLNSQPGYCDGQGNCVVSTCSDTRSNVSVCGSRVCGDAKDNCGVMRNCGSCTSGTCNAAGQCESSCTDTRSNASVCELHVCGDVADSCGVQRNCGSCSEWQVCDAGSCKDASVVITVGSAGDVVAGNWFTLPFTLQPESSFFILRQPAWPPGATISNTPGSRSLSAVPGNDDVGTHTISLTIERVGVTTMVVGQTSTVISVLCNPKDPDVGACCGDNGAYKMNGSGCAYSANETGTCTQHRCVRVCTANTARICVGNAVTHADSCGQPGDTIDNCGLNARTCVEVNGVASCAAAPQSCTGSYTYECRGPAGSQYGVRIDTGCGRTNTTVTCSASQTCTATDSGVSCRDKGLCDDLSGTIQCGQRCVGPLTSRTDCGGCGRQCGRNSQCSKGECRPIPGCSVVCDTNAQCGQDEVCINGGDCTRSQCQAVNILEQNRSTVEEIAAELTTSGLVRVATTIRKNVIAYTVTNLGPSPVMNVVITSTFGKVITGDATTLTVDGVGYEILRRDPVLRFTIPKLETTKEFTVTADHILDPTYINMIAHELNYTAAGDIIDAWNRTKEALSVGINSEYSGNRTTFHLTLNPSKSLGGVSVPLEIPKCLAEKAAQLQLSGKYQIIQEDPLIVWQFDDLERPTEVTFSVPGDIDEECKAQLRAMAFSQRIGKPLNPWLSLALIPIIGFLLIFFQRFTPEMGKKERLSKDEFERIARQQGLPAEEVERHWRDYRRRF